MAAPCISKAFQLCLDGVLVRPIYCSSLTLHCKLSLPIRLYATKKSSTKSRRKSSPLDPRYRAMYPYVPGDPIHETEIRKATETKGLNNNFKTIKHTRSTMQNQHRPFDSIRSNMTAHGNTNSGLTYTRLTDGDIRFGRTILSVRSKAKSSGDILLEGQRLIRDSMLLGAELKSLYFSDEILLQDLPLHLLKDVELFKVLYRDLKIWTDTTTPSGIMGIFKKPNQGETTHPRDAVLPITLILDSVTDPGNAGTIVRTAAAVGCDKILAVKGCVSMWEGKVLRSGMGGHFVVPIYSGLSWPQVYNYVGDKSQVLLAEPKALEADIPLLDNYGKLQERLDAHDELEMDQSDSSESSSTDDDDDDDDATISRQKMERELNFFHTVPFPSSSYCDLQLQNSDTPDKDLTAPSHISLVLGGETKGLSASAKKFAYDYYGQVVTLPMSNNIDSLNTAVAGSILLYEIRRKLFKRCSDG